MKVAISTSQFGKCHDAPLAVLRDRGVHTVHNPHGRTLQADEVIALAEGCQGLIAGTECLDKYVLRALPKLRTVCRCGVGTDNVDKEAMKALGISLHTTSAPSTGVAELTLANTLNLLRHVSCMERDMRAGVWKKRMGHCLFGKNVGIIGFGEIGQAVALLFSHMCTVKYYDPNTFPDEFACYRFLPLDDLLGWADIVTVHCSSPPVGGSVCANGMLLDKNRLQRMRKGSWLVNMARGGLVDEEALAEMLACGHIAGAALDVFSAEPYVGSLLAFDNVVLTPHCASYAYEDRLRMEMEAVKKLLHALEL